MNMELSYGTKKIMENMEKYIYNSSNKNIEEKYTKKKTNFEIFPTIPTDSENYIVEMIIELNNEKNIYMRRKMSRQVKMEIALFFIDGDQEIFQNLIWYNFK